MKNHTHSRLTSALTILLLVTACSEPSTDRDSSASAVAVRDHAVAGPVLLADQARPTANTACDPLAQDCPPGELCVDDAYGFACITDDLPEAGETFAPCAYFDACAPGFYCITSELSPECDQQEVGCCLPWCDTEAPDCPDEHTCEAWYTPGNAPPGLEHIGLCIQP